MFAIRSTFVALILSLTACAQLGLPTATTFNEKLAAGYSSVTAVRSSATTLLVAKKISSDDAQNIQTQADTARAGLDVARTISKTDQTAANARLTAIRTVLTALSTYLASRQ